MKSKHKKGAKRAAARRAAAEKVATEKDLIDILPGNKIELQDPVFEYWLKHIYR